MAQPSHPHSAASLREGFGTAPRPNPLTRAVNDAGDTLAYAFDRDIRSGFWQSTFDSMKMIPAYLGFYLLSERLVAQAVVTKPFNRFVKARIIEDRKVTDDASGEERIERHVIQHGNEHTVRSVINVFGWFAAVYSVRIVGRLLGGAQEKKNQFAQDMLAIAANHAACLRDDLDVAEQVFIQAGGRFQDLLHTIAEQNTVVRKALSELEATFPDMARMIREGHLADLAAIPNLPPEKAAALKHFTDASAHMATIMGEHLGAEDMARLNLMASAALESRFNTPMRRTYLGPVQPHTVRGFFARLADTESPAGATDVQSALATLHTVVGRNMEIAFQSDDGKTLSLPLHKKERGHIAAALYEHAKAIHLDAPVLQGKATGEAHNPYDDRIMAASGNHTKTEGLDGLRTIAKVGTGALLAELEGMARQTLKRDVSEAERHRLLDAVERTVHPLLERQGLAERYGAVAHGTQPQR